MMFSRIMVVRGQRVGEISWLDRFVRTLRDGGHAVHECLAQEAAASSASALAAACRAFDPRILLWDEAVPLDASCADVLSRLPLQKALLSLHPWDDEVPDGFDYVIAVGAGRRVEWRGAVLAIPAAVDVGYRTAHCSEPGGARAAVCCTQTFTKARGEAMRAAADALASAVVATHPSWPDGLQRQHPFGNEAHYLRKARYAVFFGAEQGEPPFVEADVAMRMAEGCVVLVERGAEQALSEGPLRSAVVPFAPGKLVEAVGRLEATPAVFEAAASKQRAALDALGGLSGCTEAMVDALSHAALVEARPAVRTFAQRAVTVVLYGWFGARNFGDDLLMRIVVWRVRKKYANSRICVIGADPARIRGSYGLEAAAPHEKWRIEEFLRQARALVFCGGLVFDDPMAQTAGSWEFAMDPWIEPSGQAALCLMARTCGVPAVFLGAGAGPVETSAAQRAVQLMGLAGARFLPRDRAACDLLRACGVAPAQVSQRADLVYGSRELLERLVDGDPAAALLQAVGLAPSEYAIVSLRQWHRCPTDFAVTLADVCDEIASSGIKILFVPFDDEDVDVHRLVYELMDRADDAVCLLERPSERQLLGLVSCSRGAVAMRLHCSILHWMFGKPAVGLNYNDKIEAQFAAVGQGTNLLPLDAPAEAIAAKALPLLTEALAPRPVASEIARMAQQVDAAFDELFSIVESAAARAVERQPAIEVFYPRSVSRDAQELERVRRQAAAAGEELGRVQEAMRQAQSCIADQAAEVDALRGSTSYRLGNGLVRPFARFKRGN